MLRIFFLFLLFQLSNSEVVSNSGTLIKESRDTTTELTLDCVMFQIEIHSSIYSGMKKFTVSKIIQIARSVVFSQWNATAGLLVKCSQFEIVPR